MVRTEKIMMRRIQNIAIDIIPGVPKLLPPESLPGCSGCCPHSLPVSLTGKFLSSSGMQVMFFFSQDPELRQDIVASIIPEIYKYFYCNIIR
jgi:hypothetical protein